MPPLAPRFPARPAPFDPGRAYGGRKVLVAGADGFLGVNCALRLRAAGAEVTLLSRRPQPRAGRFASRHVRADLRDTAVAASRPVVAFCSSRLVYSRPDRLRVAEGHSLRRFVGLPAPATFCEELQRTLRSVRAGFPMEVDRG